MVQQYKIDKVSDLRSNFQNNSDYIFVDYRGLSVERISVLRRKLRSLNSKFVVTKNNYIKILAKERGADDLKGNVFGPTAVAFTSGDKSTDVIRSLLDFSKESTMKVKGGWIDGKVYDAAGIEALSKLPGKLQLIVMLMSTMNAPLQNFVYSCYDVIGRFVRVVNSVAERRKGA